MSIHKDLKKCETLDELLETLTCENAYNDEPNPDECEDYSHELMLWEQSDNGYKYKDDMCDLPKFGGKEPKDTMGIWSWDENRLLVGDNFDQLEIIDRD